MKKFKPPVNITQEIKVRKPYLLAAGPGTGNAGLIALEYIRSRLGAQPFAEIEMHNFYTPPFIVKVEDGLLRLDEMAWEGEKPENKFYYWNTGRANDLIFFTGSAQPLPGKSSELAFRVMEVAQALKVERVYIAGAFATDVHHKAEPGVMGLASNTILLQNLKTMGIPVVPPMNIAFNLNVFLTGAAMQSGMDVIGLVAESPFYTVEQVNLKVSGALVRQLCRLLDIESLVNLADIQEMMAVQEKRIDERIAELRNSNDEKARALIDYLEILEKKQRERPSAEPAITPRKTIPIPDSLKPIAVLYEKARKDKTHARHLIAELDKLSHDDRMQMLKIFGGELLEIIQRNKP